MQKIIYVCGMGHNGSTVFDLILDKAPNLRSVGQLNNLLVPDDPRDDRDKVRSQFWTKILDSMTADEIGDMIRANSGVAKEKSLWSHVFRHRARRRYASANERVIDLIFSNIPETTIIDSSKNVARCLGLLELSNCEVYVIHLIRDVRGFVNSHNMRRREQRRRPEYLLPTLFWFVKNLAASLFVRPRARNFVAIKYEDLLADPVGVIDRLVQFIGEDLNDSRRAVLGESPLDSSRALGFSGNRILHARRQFYFDSGKARRDGVYRSRLYWMSCGWISKPWGYRFAEH